MKQKDFTTTLLVDRTPTEVFNAINNVRGWWQGEIEGSTDKLNEQFVYRFNDMHESTQKIIELVPDKKVVWLVTDSELTFVRETNEWNGTKIAFEISEKDGRTQLVFTHVGLVPDIECYGACSNAWSRLVQHSLLSLITTGKGKKIF